MLSLINRIASRLLSLPFTGLRSERVSPGVVARMMIRDMNNLDSLTRALGAHRL
jgi:hypothetical protein